MNEQHGYNSEEEIDLLEYLRVTVKYKKLIGGITGAAIILSVIVSLILPKVYSSSASVMPQQTDNSFGSALASGLPSGLGGLASGFLGAKSHTDTWVGILKSNTVKDEIIRRFNLRDVYGEDNIEDTRKALDKASNIDKSKEDIITISVEDKDPARAADIANAFVEELDRINREVVMTSGKRTRTFIEKRLGEARVELTRIEDRINDFQNKNKAVNLDEQSKAIIEALGTVKGQLMAKEVELQTLLSYATDTNPQVQLLRTEVGEIKNQLKDLEQGGAGRKDIFIPTDKLSDLAMNYGRLLRDAKVQETLFELLTQQYELARIQEAQDSPTVQVLDRATVPEKKSKPKRGLIVALSTVTGAFMALLTAFVMDYIERKKTCSGSRQLNNKV